MVIFGVIEIVVVLCMFDDILKDVICKVYMMLQVNIFGFFICCLQSQMIGVVLCVLLKSGGVGVVEVLIGVGKSLGYFIVGVFIVLVIRKKLVISIGIVVLQLQLVECDILNFFKVIGLEVIVVLVKGCICYLCMCNVVEVQGEGLQGGMFEDDVLLFDWLLVLIEMDIVKCLIDVFIGGSWDGDIDNVLEIISFGLCSCIIMLVLGCVGCCCVYLVQCVVLCLCNIVCDVQIVVINYVLLLLVLLIGDSDNGQLLIVLLLDMLLVLDEGYYIGNVVIDQGVVSLVLDEMVKCIGCLQILIVGVYCVVDKDCFGNLLLNEVIEVVSNVVKQLCVFCDYIECVWMLVLVDEELMWCVVNGCLFEVWCELIEVLVDDICSFYNWVYVVIVQVVKGKLDDVVCECLQCNLGMVLEMIEQQYNLWQVWCCEDKDGVLLMVCWVIVICDGDLVLYGLLVLVVYVLCKLLWDEVDLVVMILVMLIGGGDFQLLVIDNGILEEVEMVLLLLFFDLFNQVELIVLKFLVILDDCEGYLCEVVCYFDIELDWCKGLMVLFILCWKMEKVVGLMLVVWCKQVLVQGEMFKICLIEEYLWCVEVGEGLVLFGLNLFGEGFDLFGEVCIMVVIIQVLFVVLIDLQIVIFSEWFEGCGLNVFNLIVILYVLCMLIQFVGCLICIFIDIGCVIIFDLWLLICCYGKCIIDVLLLFKCVIG